MGRIMKNPAKEDWLGNTYSWAGGVAGKKKNKQTKKRQSLTFCFHQSDDNEAQAIRRLWKY